MADNQSQILVPVGFSEQSFVALEQALIFAKALNAHVTVLAVIEENNFLKRVFSSNTKEKEKDYRHEIQDKLKEVANEFEKKSGLNIKSMVTQGVVYEEIKKVAELIEADLVVMGTNGKTSNLRKRFIGTNAFRVVSSVDPPVITINGVRNITKIDTIFLPIVMEKKSKEKVGPALFYARLFNAKINIVGILETEDTRKVYKQHLKQVKKFINDGGVNCESFLINADNDKSLINQCLDTAYEQEADLIIITEEDKERDITDYFMTSRVQEVIHLSEVPVMCITPSKTHYQALWSAL